MTSIRALIVDDEPPARRKILRFLKAEPDIEVAGEAGSGAEAIAAIRQYRPDLVFLDVQMPDCTGFEVLEATGNLDRLHVIFVTAHDHYALRAFEVHALDYLLKPVDPKRFESVLARACRQILQSHESGHWQQIESMLRDLGREPRYPGRLLVSAGKVSMFLGVEKIEWVEADRNYLAIHAAGETYTVRATLESFAAQLDPRQFMRINRSRIVNVDSIREMQPWFHGEYRIALKDGTHLTWSRRFAPKTTPFLLE